MVSAPRAPTRCRIPRRSSDPVEDDLARLLDRAESRTLAEEPKRTSLTNKATLEKTNEAITLGDYEGFLGFCTEHTTWNFVGERRLEGKIAVREYMAETYKEPPPFDVERMTADGDVVAAMGKTALKDDAGTTTQYAYADVWRFEDGKLAELHAYVVELGAG